MEDAIDVDAHELRPLVLVGVDDVGGDAIAGIVDQHVQASVALRDRLYHVAHGGGVAHVHFARFGGASPRADVAGHGFGGRRKAVGQDHGGAFARPRERVHAEVALEMQQRLAAHVADLRSFHGQEGGLTGLEGGDIVEGGGGMDRRDLIPPALIRERFFVHDNSLASTCGAVYNTDVLLL